MWGKLLQTMLIEERCKLWDILSPKENFPETDPLCLFNFCAGH